MTDTKYAKPALKFDDVPKWFKDMRNSSDFMPTKFDLKPMSYNYMALVEQPNRSQAYSPASAQSRVDIGTQYHRPTDNVAKAIKSNQTVWQDIKNLGGEVKEHGGNLLGRVIDVLSRPGYAIRNMYLENAKRNYTTANSAGGTKMTGGEHMLAILDMTPFGQLRNAVRGQIDDDARAAWAGLSGKAKTNTADVLKQVTPGWWAKNQNTKLGLAASITGDILIDPTTWLTMGLNPGSVTRAGVGVGKLLTFDKAGAVNVFKDTIFTPTGMKQSVKTMKSDLLQAEYNKTMREAAKYSRRGDKVKAKAAKGKATKHAEAFYRQKATDLATKAEQDALKTLQGVDLAVKMLKRNLNPLNAMQTASRFTTGAKAGSDAFRGANSLKEAADVLYTSAADSMKNGEESDLWNRLYAASKDKDFEYTHNKTVYKVNLSKAKDYDDWLKMIAQESAPVAAYKEWGSKAARSRAGRIMGTEARGNAFKEAYGRHIYTSIKDSLDPTTWGAAKSSLAARWGLNDVFIHGHVDDVARNHAWLPTIHEDDILSGKHTQGTLMDESKAAWETSDLKKSYEAEGLGKDKFNERRARVIVVNDQGMARVIRVESLKKFNRRVANTSGSKLKNAAAAEARTPQQKVTDTLTGVSDDVAGRRDALLRDHAEAMARRDEAAARVVAAGEDVVKQADVAAAIQRRFQDSDNIDSIRAILDDDTKPWEERIVTLLSNDMFDDSDVNGIVKDAFNVFVDSNGVLKVTRTADATPEQLLNNIPEVVRTVIEDRLRQRVPEHVWKSSGYQVVDGKLVEGVPAPWKEGLHDYRQDVHGEIGLALLDAYSAGLKYAADSQLLSDPNNFEAVVDLLATQATEFINLATADLKVQVTSLLANTYGVRLPEQFVPTGSKVNKTFGNIKNSDFKFLKTDGTEASQDFAWGNLGLEIQSWVANAFPWMKIDRAGAGRLAPYKLDSETFLKKVATTDKEAAEALNRLHPDYRPAFSETMQETIDKANVLFKKVAPKDFNGTGVSETLHYSAIDFILHSKEILEAQRTLFIPKGAPGKVYMRVNQGRLSALDSFSFIDDETKAALQSLEDLKRWARSSATHPSAVARRAAAQATLNNMFIDAGGIEHLDYVNNILSATDYSPTFNTLGAHARLKQTSLYRKDTVNGGLGSKQAADLMEHMWASETQAHELMKAAHHSILTQALLDGRTHAQIAEEISTSLDQTLAGHEKLKKLLYPVYASGKKEGMEASKRTLQDRAERLRETAGWPRNEILTGRNAPKIEEGLGARQVYLPEDTSVGTTSFTSSTGSQYTQLPDGKWTRRRDPNQQNIVGEGITNEATEPFDNTVWLSEEDSNAFTALFDANVNVVGKDGNIHGKYYTQPAGYDKSKVLAFRQQGKSFDEAFEAAGGKIEIRAIPKSKISTEPKEGLYTTEWNNDGKRIHPGSAVKSVNTSNVNAKGKTSFHPEELKIHLVAPKDIRDMARDLFPAKVSDAAIRNGFSHDVYGEFPGLVVKGSDGKERISLATTEKGAVAAIPVKGDHKTYGMFVHVTPSTHRKGMRKGGVLYISPDGVVFKTGVKSLKDVDGINLSMSEILRDTPVTAMRRDASVGITTKGSDNTGYANAPHVMAKDINVTKTKPAKAASTLSVGDARLAPVLEGSKAEWERMGAQAKMDELQKEINALPTEAPTAAPAANEVPAAAVSDDAVDEGIPVGEGVNPEDLINAQTFDGLTYEELAPIREWIETRYAGADPEEVSKALYGHVMAMTTDMWSASARLQQGLSDMNIQNKASIRFMGAPIAPMINPNNATHAVAGVTAMAQYRSKAHKFFADLMDPATNPNTWFSNFRLWVTKESQILEGRLYEIRRTTVNAASILRKDIIQNLNNLYKRLLEGEYTTGSMAGLSRKERFKMATDTMFNPGKVKQKDAFDIFEQADGTNPLKTIASMWEGNGINAFGPQWETLAHPELEHKLHLFNNYMPKKFRLQGFEITEISKMDIPHVPYSREWLAAVGQRMPNSKLSTSRLLDANLAEIHYAMSDASLRIGEGRTLYNSIWGEFAFRVDNVTAEYMNKSVIPATVGADGKPMRQRMVRVSEIKKGSNPWGIDPNTIPEEFAAQVEGINDYWIDSSYLDQIGTLSRFMQGTDKLSDVLNAGFLDKLLQYFKASVTIYKIPTYPIRNTMADVFLSAMDGLTQPKYYKWAASIMQNAHRLSKELDDPNLGRLMDEEFMATETARALHDPLSVADPHMGPGLTKIMLHTADGEVIRLDDAQVVRLFEELSLGQNQLAGEVKELIAGSRIHPMMRAGGAMHDGLRKFNDWRESWARMAHFLYALEKEAPMGGNLADIAHRAAQRVIKHHFDYNDVSVFERNVVAPLIPFYKWVRNVIPYTIASVVTKPYMLKTEQAVQQGLQGLSDDPDDPRTDFVVPEWIRREKAVPIGFYTDAQGFNFMQWASVNLPLSETITNTFAPSVDPWIDPSGGDPYNRYIQSGEGVFQTTMAMMNPMIKAAVQGATGKEVWAHGPADQKGNWASTLASMVPTYPTLTAMQKSVDTMTAGEESGKNKIAQILSELGAISVMSNSEKAQIGEVKRIQDLNEAKRDQLKADLMNRLEKRYPQTTSLQRKQIVDEYVKSMRSSNG